MKTLWILFVLVWVIIGLTHYLFIITRYCKKGVRRYENLAEWSLIKFCCFCIISSFIGWIYLKKSAGYLYKNNESSFNKLSCKDYGN